MTATAAPRQRSLQVSPDIRLDLLEAGTAERGAIVFLHGFPEAAFIWEPLLEHFGKTHHAVAPNLRGYAGSSKPGSVEAYRTRHIVADREFALQELDSMPHAPRHAPRRRVHRYPPAGGPGGFGFGA